MGEEESSFSTGRLTRTVEIPYYENQRRNVSPYSWTPLKLFNPNYGVRIYDMGKGERRF
jgi:hypothetical protein